MKPRLGKQGSLPLVRLCCLVIPLLGEPGWEAWALGGPGTTASEVTLLPNSEVPSQPSASLRR